MFFVGQDLKQVHMTYLFLNFYHLLINSSKYLSFGVYSSLHQRNIAYKIQTPKETNHKTDTNRFTFSLASDIEFEKSCFFYVELKILINNFLNFSKLHEHIFRYSRSQMFFKIGVLKNFVIIWIKKRLNTGFSCEYCENFRNSFLRTPPAAVSAFF